MELLFVLVVALMVLGLAAVAWGTDSRASFLDPRSAPSLEI